MNNVSAIVERMPKGKKVQDMLEARGISVGDIVEATSSDGRRFRGVVMPHHEFSGESIVTIKLDSGYNVGVALSDLDSLSLVSKAESKQPKKREIPMDKSKKTVSVISTGGTIASYVDYRTGAVHPAISAEEMVFSVPELLDICNVRAEVLCSVLSENMKRKNWTQLAERVCEHLNSGSVGCIIPHGTDTLGFTSAALSFSLSNVTGPVVLVGSQRSSDRPSSDATSNLLSAARLCTESNLGEVVVLMHAATDDTALSVHRATRVRKNHSSRRDAFKSVNEPTLGLINAGGIELRQDSAPRGQGDVKVDAGFEEEVVLLNFYPGLSGERFRKAVDGAKGVVIAGTGLGHVSQDIIDEISSLTEEGMTVCVTTQCIWGSANLNVYSTGRDMQSAGAIPLGDMLSETAYVKLSWVLAKTQDPARVREMMLENLRGELTDRRFL